MASLISHGRWGEKTPDVFDSPNMSFPGPGSVAQRRFTTNVLSPEILEILEIPQSVGHSNK